MSRVEDLIARHCPNGVDEKLISDVATLERGKYISKKTAIPGDIPVIAGGRGPAYWHNESNRAGELLTVAGSGAYAGFVQYWDSPIFVSDAFSITTDPQLNTRFLFHWMKNKQEFLHSLKKGSGVPHVYPKDISTLKIPVPPLEVQDEIVRILDSYTQLEQDLESELETELEARREQYEYYRDSLLSLENLTNRLGEDNVKLLPLKDVSSYSIEKISTSLTDKNSYVGVDSLIANKRGKKPSDYAPKTNKLSEFHPGDILIGNIRPYLRKIWHSDLTGGASGDVLVITIKDEKRKEIISKFLYHVLASENFFEYDSRFAKGAKMPRGDKKAIMEYKFPLPSLSEQERIVAILDKFDALVNDLSSGLPAEIEARRKQYEYYRDRLLTFTPAK